MDVLTTRRRGSSQFGMTTALSRGEDDTKHRRRQVIKTGQHATIGRREIGGNQTSSHKDASGYKFKSCRTTCLTSRRVMILPRARARGLLQLLITRPIYEKTRDVPNRSSACTRARARDRGICAIAKESGCILHSRTHYRNTARAQLAQIDRQHA